jgi:hypothetical protein
MVTSGVGRDCSSAEQWPEAAIHFRLAAAADLDASSTIAARDGALKAEQAGGAIKIPEDIASFLQKFDAAVLQSTSAVVNPSSRLESATVCPVTGSAEAIDLGYRAAAN